MRVPRVVPFAAAAALFAADAGADDAKTTITVWSSPSAGAMAGYGAYGGYGYGGYTAPSGAMITERREVDVTAGGEVRITGIAATVDPATVQLRSLTDPGGLTVSEQRFVPGASTPDEILARHVGDTVTIVTPKSEVTGVLLTHHHRDHWLGAAHLAARYGVPVMGDAQTAERAPVTPVGFAIERNPHILAAGWMRTSSANLSCILMPPCALSLRQQFCQGWK